MITVSFTTSQVVGAPQGIVIVDTSTGTDVTAVSRRIYLITATGQYLSANGLSDSVAYTEWPLADGNTITLDYLTETSALDVRLDYVNVSGSPVSTLTSLKGFTLYAETFYYSLTQAQAQQNSPPPTILQDSNYYMNKLILRTNIDSGNQAIELGDDISSAQNCYNLATYMILNEADFF